MIENSIPGDFSLHAINPVFGYIAAEQIPSISCEYMGEFFCDAGKFHQIRRMDSWPWFIARTKSDLIAGNFQGNPLWPSRCLRDFPSIKGFFGLSDDESVSECVIPDAVTINKRLELISTDLGESINYKYAVSIAENERLASSLEFYVDSFVDRRLLPFGLPGTIDFLHDWSYHFLPLLYPFYLENIRLCLSHIRKRLFEFSFVSEKVSRQWNYYGHSLDSNGQYISDYRNEELSIRTTIYRQMARAIDVCTARVTQLSVCLVNGHRQQLKSALKDFAIFIGPLSNTAIERVLFLESRLDTYRIETNSCQCTDPGDSVAYLQARLKNISAILEFSEY